MSGDAPLPPLRSALSDAMQRPERQAAPISATTSRKIRLPSTTSAGLLAHILKAVREHGAFERVQPWCDALAHAQELAGDKEGAALIREASRPAEQKSNQFRQLGNGAHASIVTWRPPLGHAPRPMLSAKASAKLDKLIVMLRHRHKLADAGVDPPTRLLFQGPSGTGKTMTAIYIADQLGLPIAIVQIDRFLGSLLGATSSHVCQAFAEASGMCVLFLDEIDALSTDRGGDEKSDVGEMRRATATLLQQLDLCEPSRIVIGATNVPQVLDAALARRLPFELDFGWLDADSREQLVEQWLPAAIRTRKLVFEIAEKCDATGAALRARTMRIASEKLLALWESQG